MHIKMFLIHAEPYIILIHTEWCFTLMHIEYDCHSHGDFMTHHVTYDLWHNVTLRCVVPFWFGLTFCSPWPGLLMWFSVCVCGGNRTSCRWRYICQTAVTLVTHESDQHPPHPHRRVLRFCKIDLVSIFNLWLLFVWRLTEKDWSNKHFFFFCLCGCWLQDHVVSG